MSPEGEDERTITAAAHVTEQRIARVTVLGDEERIRARAAAIGVSLTNVPVLDHRKSSDIDRYAQTLYEQRRARGTTLDEARRQVADPLYFGNLMVRAGRADGSVAGATNTTAHTVRSALLTIGLAEGLNLVSSFFIMVVPDQSFGTMER
jgi:phosphate acetyltransferase